MKRFLVTGGAGFIGSHLCDGLLASGASVIALDDLSTGSLENLAPARRHPNFHFVRGDIADATTVDAVVNEVDGVFHLAAAVGVNYVLENPERVLRTNIGGTENVLDAAGRRGTPVLLMSSSEVYGHRNEMPLREEMPLDWSEPEDIRWLYAYSKYLNEVAAQERHERDGLPVIMVRLFNTVGPRQTGRYGMVIPRLVGQALTNAPITVYGDGSQRRCFSHVSDVVRGLIQLASEEAANGHPFNLGAFEDTSIEGLARRIVSLTGSRSEIQLIPYEQAYGMSYEDTMIRVPSLERIKRIAGYEPHLSLDRVLSQVIRFERNRLQKEVTPLPGRVTPAAPLLAIA